MLVTKKRRLKQQFKANSLEDLIIPGFMLEIKKFPHPRGCWIWGGTVHVTTGYGKFSFLHGSYLAHRIAWMLFKGTIPDGLWILHSCDTPPCVNPDHLFLGTQKDNTCDMWKKGRYHSHFMSGKFEFLKGENHPTAKLTAEQVRFIRKSPLTAVSISKMFGVSASVIGYARRGKSYSSVK